MPIKKLQKELVQDHENEHNDSYIRRVTACSPVFALCKNRLFVVWTKHHGGARIKRKDHNHDQGLLWKSAAGFFFWVRGAMGAQVLCRHKGSNPGSCMDKHYMIKRREGNSNENGRYGGYRDPD